MTPEALTERLAESIAVVGAGAVGTALARRLAARGGSVRAVISRRVEAARRLAERVGAPVASSSVADLPADVRMVFCCVPDDAVAEVAEQLYLLPRDWSGALVAHTSGALTSAVLVPLAARGAAALSFHPMQAFAADGAPEGFEGIYVGLEGSPLAVRAGAALAELLGARPLPLSPEEKLCCHLAAAIASNFTVTLQAMAAEVLATAGIDRPRAAELLRPLVEGTWRNLARRLPEDALTGPIARGDDATVRRHLDALARRLPHLTPAYAAMAVETVRLAVRGGRLSESQARQLLDTLDAALAE